MAIPKTLAGFGELYPAETGLVEWLRAGRREVFPVSGGLPPDDAPIEHRLRAEFVRFLALGGCEDCSPSEKGLGLKGAYIEGAGLERGGSRGLDLRGCTVRGDLRMESCRFPDKLLLRGAQIQSLFLDKSVLVQGMNADFLNASESVILRFIQAKETVQLVGAKLGGNLGCVGAKFEGERISLNVQGIAVSRGFYWRAGAAAAGTVNLDSAKFGLIADDAESWPKAGNLRLNNCKYGAFYEGPATGALRKKWLALQYASAQTAVFWPQPYEECARALREAGHFADARTVLIAKEGLQRKARRMALRADNHYGLARVFAVCDAVLGATVRYGRMPLLAFAWLAVFWLFGVVVFGGAESFGAIKPNLPQVQRAPEWVLCGVALGSPVALASQSGKTLGLQQPLQTQYDCYRAQPEALSYPQFNAFVYSADVLLPVVSLEMQSYWLPDDKNPFGIFARWYLWLQIIIGWALTLLAVAGLSGLIKQDSK
jgi:hypothetical protein